MHGLGFATVCDLDNLPLKTLCGGWCSWRSLADLSLCALDPVSVLSNHSPLPCLTHYSPPSFPLNCFWNHLTLLSVTKPFTVSPAPHVWISECVLTLELNACPVTEPRSTHAYFPNTHGARCRLDVRKSYKAPRSTWTDWHWADGRELVWEPDGHLEIKQCAHKWTSGQGRNQKGNGKRIRDQWTRKPHYNTRCQHQILHIPKMYWTSI